MKNFLRKVLLTVAQLLIGPFMLIYLAGDWVVQGVKRIFK
jgi:hypothetical protein